MRAQVIPTADAPASVPPAARAWTRLLRAHAATARQLGAELQAEHGLSINDYEALELLARADGRRLKRVDLARRLVLTPSGVTRLLEGLEETGLVARASCPADLRVSYAELTDAGAERLEAASCSHVGSIQAVLEEHLSDEEIEELAELLGRLPGVAEGDGDCGQALDAEASYCSSSPGDVPLLTAHGPDGIAAATKRGSGTLVADQELEARESRMRG